MPCSPAWTCKQALTEATFFWPNRVRISDGICGDEAHQARKSDHNTGDAFDLTHDPFNGLDTYALARMLAEEVLAGREERVKYIISNGMIFSKRLGKWAWRKYTGANKHDHHMHVSIYDWARNSRDSWWARFMPKEIEVLSKEEHDAVMTANHFVKIIWPKELKPRLDALEDKLDELLKKP